MTKKDYVFIAETLKSELINENGDKKTLQSLASQFSGRLAADNPRFNSQRFLKACGLV